MRATRLLTAGLAVVLVAACGGGDDSGLTDTESMWCEEHPAPVDRANRVVNSFPENGDVFSEEFAAAYQDAFWGEGGLPDAVRLLQESYPAEYALACKAAKEQCESLQEGDPGYESACYPGS